MNISKKIWYLFSIAVCLLAVTAFDASAQDRERVVTTVSSRPTNQPLTQPAPKTPSIESRPTSTRPPLLQDIRTVSPEPEQQLVKKTVSSVSTNAIMNSIAAGRTVYGRSTSEMMQKAIFSRLGIPYLYGSSGPRRYDCSGFVWAVFADAGINFTRQSARSLWAMSEPVSGDDRFKFGTLVFLNGLGHMGIVADENGFYHASSSKGITYSPFAGYWEGRIVGFRRLVTPDAPVAPVTQSSK